MIIFLILFLFFFQAGETPLHAAVRFCHWEVCNEILRFVTNSKSKFDATILVNQTNNVSERSKQRHVYMLYKIFPLE